MARPMPPRTRNVAAAPTGRAHSGVASPFATAKSSTVATGGASAAGAGAGGATAATGATSGTAEAVGAVLSDGDGRVDARIRGCGAARTGGSAVAGVVVAVVTASGAMVGSGAGVGMTIVGAVVVGAVVVVAGAESTGASVIGAVASCAWARPGESISMAEIAMVLRGDMALSFVMKLKRDEPLTRFPVGDEPNADWR